tara:strand:- start:310 stop:849 length:540 start_codon:yes stop_codon:yes gene_type:complete
MCSEIARSQKTLFSIIFINKNPLSCKVDTAEEYIARMHQNFRSHLDEDIAGLCHFFAWQVSRRLKEQDRPHRFLFIREAEDSSKMFPSYIRFHPVIYKGKVWFSSHTVCEADNGVLDPLVGDHIPLEEYLQTVFDRVMPCEELSPEDKKCYIDSYDSAFDKFYRIEDVGFYQSLSFDCT